MYDPMPGILSIRPDTARSEIRLARRQFEHARNCAADCSRLLSVTGEPVPRSVADYWRLVALRQAQYHREMARRAILDAWPYEWLRARMLAAVPARKTQARRAAA